MAKIKLTKNELKKQKDSMKMFKRYLPTLQLKKQQLQMEIRGVEDKKKAKELEKDKFLKDLESWVSVFGEVYEFDKWIKIKSFLKGRANIAGVDIPVLEDIEYEDIDYDLIKTSPWVDSGVLMIKQVVKLTAEYETLEEQLRLLNREFQVTSQRVNLFEKVMIPSTKNNIKKINVYLGDQQTASVVRGKIAKVNLSKEQK